MSKRLILCISLAPLLFADWAFAQGFLQQQASKRKAEYRAEQEVRRNVVIYKPNTKIKQTIVISEKKVEPSSHQAYILVPADSVAKK